MADADSEIDEIEKIRQRKREQLIEAKTGGPTPSSPSEPTYAESRSEFESFVNEHDIVLVDFYADWCGPCQMLNPIVEAVARNTDAAVLKVDIDRLQSLAREQRVQGVPTMILYADGNPVERMVGVKDEGTLTSLIERYAAQP